MSTDELCLFCLAGSQQFGAIVSEQLGIPPSELEERNFEDGEHKSRSLMSVRSKDVFVIHSLYSDENQSVNDKLCRLLFFIGSLKDASARQVTAIIPYLCYARKDRKTKSRDPVTTRYVANLLEAVGTDRVLTVDVHNLTAFQNAFRCQTEHIEAKKLFVDYFVPLLGDDEIVVVSPDAGGVKRAEQFRQALSHRFERSVVSAFMEKQRSAGVVSGQALVGDVKDKTAVIIDDMISTGGTIARTVDACHARGGRRLYAAATHGLFVGDAGRVLSHPALEKVVITNTIPPFRLDPEFTERKIVVLNAASLVADAIHAIHSAGSIVELLEI
ncbi:MAG: ribose-phosphate pyrophosphokinase [Gammaproteobacteria bacterium]|nr:ribose-phosphate pyrophosphokinase [Gammaproteobacteria bacterium]